MNPLQAEFYKQRDHWSGIQLYMKERIKEVMKEEKEGKKKKQERKKTGRKENK